MKTKMKIGKDEKIMNLLTTLKRKRKNNEKENETKTKKIKKNEIKRK